MKWIKPNGNTIEANDNKATIEYAESLGWKRATVKKAVVKKKAVKKAAKK